MEPGSESGNNHPPEASEVNTEKLSREIASRVKLRLLGHDAMTYNNGDLGIGRDCLLTTRERDKSLLVHYWQKDSSGEPTGSINIKVLDRTMTPPSGYELIIDPGDSGEKAWVNFIPHFSAFPTEKAEDSVEAAYGVTPHFWEYDEEGHIDKGKYPSNSDDYEAQMENKQSLQTGLLLINELLKTTHPDEPAIQAVHEWFMENRVLNLNNDLNSINNFLPIMVKGLDNMLGHLPPLVDEVFDEN